MRILMLGNSFTSSNHLPEQLAKRTGAEVVAHTRGGARLAEQLNPKTRMGARTRAALDSRSFDYVVMQEMSNGPVTSPERFRDSVARLCGEIRAAGAVPVLYATWAYQRGGPGMEAMPMGYDAMYEGMTLACRRAAKENGALLAEVGTRFYREADRQPLYAADGVHPSEAGTRLAAETLAEVIINHAKADKIS